MSAPDAVPAAVPTAAEVRARLLSPGGFGMYASATEHHRYAQLLPGRHRNGRRCDCGCGGKASHAGMANGLALTSGCEWSMRRWARDGYPRRTDVQ